MIWQQIVNGVVTGGIYALVALGLTMIYGVLRLLHVAHAGIYALGAYAGLLVYGVTHQFVVALTAAMVICAAAGFLTQRFLYRPLMGTPPLVPLIASIGLFIFLGDAYRLAFGAQTLPFREGLAEPTPYRVGPIAITGTQLVILGVAALLLALTWYIINKTRLGLAWRAVAGDLEIAQAMGIDLNRSVAMNFALGSALAAAAGLLVAYHYNEVFPTMGDVPAYKMLAIVVLGGLGNPLGTVAAGFLIGLAETLVVAFAGYLLPRDAIAFVALIIILMIRPQGLFARKGA
ncbi:MAG TPA: branched-chain amino acid ABC transporter permease [Symbiobacteriaceae bacterium]|nr:branched-chain amino acid ABC transporter permease [Symbiobacteriaceae bacterium]